MKEATAAVAARVRFRKWRRETPGVGRLNESFTGSAVFSSEFGRAALDRDKPMGEAVLFIAYMLKHEAQPTRHPCFGDKQFAGQPACHGAASALIAYLLRPDCGLRYVAGRSFRISAATSLKRSSFMVFSFLRPDGQSERIVAELFKRAHSRFRLASFLAEVIKVNSQFRTIRVHIRQFWNLRRAQSFRGHELGCRLSHRGTRRQAERDPPPPSAISRTAGSKSDRISAFVSLAAGHAPW